MSINEQVAELDARIGKTKSLLSRIDAEYDAFMSEDFTRMGRKNTSAMVIAELMVDYYTCLETCFFRISQFFENNLSQDRWHADLLEKMTLRIENSRDAVVSDASAAALGELLKFRHFRRYYFELDYDWLESTEFWPLLQAYFFSDLSLKRDASRANSIHWSMSFLNFL